MKPTAAKPEPIARVAALRRRTVIDTARRLGLLGGESGRIGGSVARALVAAAERRELSQLPYVGMPAPPEANC
jgi:hypothetical protein